MRPFNASTDLEQINSWLEARGLDPLELEDMPKYGMIEDGVACGFVVLTDTSTCFIECFISNKDTKSQFRNMAFTKIARWALNFASASGFRRVIAMTDENSLLERAKQLGFAIKNKQIAVLDVG